MFKQITKVIEAVAQVMKPALRQPVRHQLTQPQQLSTVIQAQISSAKERSSTQTIQLALEKHEPIKADLNHQKSKGHNVGGIDINDDLLSPLSLNPVSPVSINPLNIRNILHHDKPPSAPGFSYGSDDDDSD